MIDESFEVGVVQSEYTVEQFFAQDKLDKEVLVEFTTIDPLAPQFLEKLHSVSDSLVRAYVPFEVQFARKFPGSLSKDKFFKFNQTIDR